MIPIGYLVLAFSVPAQYLAQATGQHLALRLQFDGSDRAQPFSLVDHVLALAAQHKCH